MSQKKLPKFNSPKEAFCTCPPKYNLNTYLGRCGHGCVYCYAVKFPSFVGPLKPRYHLIEAVEAMVKNTKPKLPVMLSDSTDPYQPIEEKLRLTRKCLEVLVKYGFPILIVTKSNLVVRDLDLLTKTRSVVAITITTFKDEIAKQIEPKAPLPEKRIKAIHFLARKNIPVVARIDPIIPFLNDDEKDFKLLVSTLASVGVKQVTVSTLKPVKGFFKKMEKINPKLSEKLKKIYSGGRWIAGYLYLPEELRFKYIKKFRSIVLSQNLNFASCRENLPQLNTTICDGTAYCQIQTRLRIF
ncbi:radical SAM protein [Candidatus Bathyarchaeota archaeon]|nr:MAG: radical SAM protein [Candidatus Bathyarchaeota archaeon]